MMLQLASASPRRRELLLQAGIPFQVIALRAGPRRDPQDETPLPYEKPEIYVQRMADEKAEAGEKRLLWRKINSGPVLGVDTIVALGQEIFGKPKNENEAAYILSRLSGMTHQVLTAMSLCSNGKKTRSLTISQVTFRQLTHADIQRYLATGEYHDKAGAYAIQGHAAVFTRMLQGSYSGVMGLPLYELDLMLQQLQEPS